MRLTRQVRTNTVPHKSRPSELRPAGNRIDVSRPTNPFYLSREWRALRAACLARDLVCVATGCRQRSRVADHIVARPPNVTVLCDADRLENLRGLCLSHDAQVKEQRRGEAQRKQRGEFTVRGCDEQGWPFDPKHSA
jgi:hypothetical protein